VGWILAFWAMLGTIASAVAHPGSGIAVDPAGRIYFTTGPMIVRIDPQGGARVIVHDRSGERFYQLHHIQRAPDGGLVTASDLGDVLWRFSPEGDLSRHYPPADSDRVVRVGLGGDPFALDPSGAVFSVNLVHGRFSQILRIDAEGRVRVMAGGDWGLEDGVGDRAKLGDLHGGSMMVEPGGAVLFTDSGVCLRRLEMSGAVVTMAGGTTRGHVDGLGRQARFDGAAGLARDLDGTLFVVETAGRVRKVSTDGQVTTVAGAGGVGHRDGEAIQALFEEPHGVAIGPRGELFVLELGATRVRKVFGGRVFTVHSGVPIP